MIKKLAIASVTIILIVFSVFKYKYIDTVLFSSLTGIDVSKLNVDPVWNPSNEQIESALIQENLSFIRNLRKSNGSPDNSEEENQSVIIRKWLLGKHGTIFAISCNFKTEKECKPIEASQEKKKKILVSFSEKTDANDLKQTIEPAQRYLQSSTREKALGLAKRLQSVINVHLFELYERNFIRYNTEYSKDAKAFTFKRILDKLPSIGILQRCGVNEKIIQLIAHIDTKDYAKLKNAAELVVEKENKEVPDAKYLKNIEWINEKDYKIIAEYSTCGIDSLKLMIRNIANEIKQKEIDLSKIDFYAIYTIARIINEINNVDVFASTVAGSYETWEYPMSTSYYSLDFQNRKENSLIQITYREENGHRTTIFISPTNENIQAIVSARTIKDVERLKIAE